MLKSILVIFIFSLWGAIGCASKSPSFGDRVMADGESRVAIAEQWEEGKSESKKGEKQVRQGRKIVEKGRADLRKGEQLIAAGNVAAQTNRQAYQALSQTVLGEYSADSASDRVSKLKKYTKAWEEAEEEIAEGNKLIQRGNSRVSEGESEIRKGQKRIERGRAKMQDAESRYQPGK